MVLFVLLEIIGKGDSMKRLFYLLICLFMLVSITGCGVARKGEAITNDNIVTPEKEEVKEENNKEEEKKEEETKVIEIGKYVSSYDSGSYVILKSDNTFTGKRNYCAGYNEVSGTYIVDEKNLILYFDQLESTGGKKAIDYFTYKKDANGKITYFDMDKGTYLIACSGGDFHLES